MGLQGTTASGIKELPNGERVIPASIRPDGTVRKERKVRPGFVPEEDISTYVNPLSKKAKAFQASNFGCRLAGEKGAQEEQKNKINISKSAKKNMKRKEARERNKSEDKSSHT